MVMQWMAPWLGMITLLSIFTSFQPGKALA